MLGPVVGVATETHVLAPVVPGGDGCEATTRSISLSWPTLDRDWWSGFPPLKVRQRDRAVRLAQVLPIGNVRIVSTQELERGGIALSQSNLIENWVRLQIHELPLRPAAQRCRIAGPTQINRADGMREDLLDAVLR